MGDNKEFGNEWYDGLDEQVVLELVDKYEGDNDYLAEQVAEQEELVHTQVESAEDLKHKHGIKFKKEHHIKRQKLQELKNKGVVGYEDNPDKYFKTSTIR